MLCLPHILALALHSQAGFNTAVPGLGALCRHGEGDAWLLGAGAYANSERAVERKVSQYLLAGAQPWSVGPVRLGAVVGLVNGYTFNSGNTLPMAAGIASLPATALPAWVPGRHLVHELHLVAIPPVRGVTPAVAQISFTLMF